MPSTKQQRNQRVVMAENFHHDGQGRFTHKCPRCNHPIVSKTTITVLEEITCSSCSATLTLEHPDDSYLTNQGHYRWTDAESEALYYLYDKITNTEIVSRFERSRSAIIQHMNYLTLYKGWDRIYKPGRLHAEAIKLSYAKRRNNQ